MTNQDNLPTSEVAALHELEQLGIGEVYGVNIQELLHIANRRQGALEQLQDAEATFHQVVSSDDESGVKSAFGKLGEALNNLQRVNYPAGEAFDLRSRALAADIARAKALQETIEVWWWRRVTEHIASFYQNIGLPGEKAFGKAQEAFNQATARVNNWPGQPETSRWREQAVSSLREMQEALKKAQASHLDRHLEEAIYWLDQAEFYQASTPAEPFAAFACLGRAEAIIKGIENEGRSFGEVWNHLQQDIEQAQSRLEGLQKKAQQTLPEWLSRQRQDEFQKLQNELRRRWQDWQQSHSEKDATEFLEESGTHRGGIDQIRFYLYQSPHIEAEPWLQKLILTRQDNLLQARQLLREIKTRWTAEGETRQYHVYWAWQRVVEAKACDPDSAEIRELQQDIAGIWEKIQQGFKNNIQQVRKNLGAIDGRTLPRAILPDDVKMHLEEARRLLDQAKQMLENQVEKPPEWTQDIEELNPRLKRWEELYQQVQALERQWGQSRVISPELIEETAKFLETPGFPALMKLSIKRALEARIGERQHGLFGQPSYAIECIELLSSLQQRASIASHQPVGGITP